MSHFIKHQPHIILLTEHAPWGIDVSHLSANEKQLIIQCSNKLLNRKSPEKALGCEKYALQLLEINPHSADYNFVASLFYNNYLFYSSIDTKKQLMITGTKLKPFDHYYNKYLFYIQKALELHPAHPIFMLYYAQTLSASTSESVSVEAFTQLNQLASLLADYNYVSKYKNSKQIVDFDAFECVMQFDYLHQLRKIGRTSPTYLKETVYSLYPRYIQLMNSNNSSWKMDKSFVSKIYAIYFSAFGQYKLAMEAVNAQYVKRIQDTPGWQRFTFDTQVHCYLAVNDYKNAQIFIKNMRSNNDISTDVSVTDKIENLMLYSAYLMRVKGEEIMNTNNIGLNQIISSSERKKINQQYRDLVKMSEFNGIDDSKTKYNYFLKCCKDFFYHIVNGKNGFKIVLISKKEQNIRFRNIKIEKKRNKFVDQYYYMNGLLNRRFKRNVSKLWISTYYFLLSLEASIIDETKNVFVKSDIPLSFYYSGLNSFELKQYQIAIKLIKKSIKFTSDIKVINQNYKKLIRKCQINLQKQKCSYCKIAGKKLKSCKGCATIFYCSKHCQKMDWKLKHKSKCSKFWVNKYHLISRIWCFTR